ncbi:sushi, von Willebrand factor type A, EGF and pentraxin domain-containing protein 1-like [Aphis craccivora]|uniref:Sushi, von Willebrand factor type A, EGF and pentraxin domain-containing protein 1-like n=1 Tax=Aphis craccivora TaxID=307492 RepID=A0A6G0Z5M8_APHCR|nr:sushi, von Willebrand factor type A, EGF and pentraxin domain-containing protein 1-like [Aphis craccivora]
MGCRYCVAITFVFSGPSDCEPRPGPDSGQVVFTASKNWRRAVEVYQCDDGYILTGQTKHTCIEGEWSGHVPSCTRPTSSGHNNNNIISSAQGWFSFRRILKLDTKRKIQNNEKRLEKKSVDIKTPETLQQTSGHGTFELPKHMIRDLAKEYSVGEYDLSCLFRKRHGKIFLKAPKLPYARVVKYSKIKNIVDPKNKYLEAIYHCIKGHVFENPSHTKLYCSNGNWVGVKPQCVPKTTPMTMYQMECYIKCPPDKNVSLAEGEKFINFEVEQPNTNYDWNRFGTLSSGWYKNSSRILVPGLYIITYTVRDDEDTDIASCRTTVRVTDDEVPSVQDCPTYLEVIEDFSKKNTVPVSWPEPRFSDNIAALPKWLRRWNRVNLWVQDYIMYCTLPWMDQKMKLYVISLLKLKVSVKKHINIYIYMPNRAVIEIENSKRNVK